ncbi:MAG: GDP-mannose 4,6-dehydratase [bacterium]|nr:GDP-mannose 4,6-dehydratase [bacterium]
MKILLTGGAGFIGSHTARALLTRGDEVIIIDDFNDYYPPRIKRHNVATLQQSFDRLRVYEADIRDFDTLRTIMYREACQKICHLAARAGVRASIADPLLYTQTNVLGTLHLLELAVETGAEHFVYASSSSVYGEMPTAPFREDMPLDKPISPYAATKKACELLAYTYHHLHGLPCTGLRFFTVYGPAGRPDMAPFLFTWNIMHGHPITRFGDGSSQRDYTYIDDIVTGVLAALDRPFGYEIFNLGNHRPISLNDFIAAIEHAVGAKAIIHEAPRQPGDVSMTCADIAKARALLGYEPHTPFEVGITHFVGWLRANRHLYL